MQDVYVGDIGDFAKYSLLRKIEQKGLKLAINWYKYTDPDGGCDTEYLSKPEDCRSYDSVVFDVLNQIVKSERTIESIENSNLLKASFYSKTMNGQGRPLWHKMALENTQNAEVVFLDPNTGLATKTMHKHREKTKKHICWHELEEYYQRGQNVIMYQNGARKTSAQLIDELFDYGENYLGADTVMGIKFSSKRTTRFFFMFLHKGYENIFKEICLSAAEGKQNIFKTIEFINRGKQNGKQQSIKNA